MAKKKTEPKKETTKAVKVKAPKEVKVKNTISEKRQALIEKYYRK